jgi:hypothetical protein
MARIIGPFLLLFTISIVLRAATLDLLVRAFLSDTPLVFVTGAFGLALGAIMIAAHNRWNAPAAIVISLISWATLIRSAMLLIAPPVVAMVAAGVTGVPGLPIVLAGIGFVVGIWLSFVGWLSKSAP